MLGRCFFDLDIAQTLYELIVDTTSDGPTKSAVVLATGMSYPELEEFLKAKGIASTGSRISSEAIPELKKWYANKMRRFVRNALALTLTPDSVEGRLFFRFCSKYLKHGHTVVKSWDDIDEARLLMDFVDACYAEHSCVVSLVGKKDNLLSRIHRCYLFSLQLKKAPKRAYCSAKTIISFILSNRYHIFTGEADSNMGLTDLLTNASSQFQFNQPWSASHCFCLHGKSQ